MEERMTDFQFNKLLQMVLEIMKSSKSLDEAIAKVERLTKKGAQKRACPLLTRQTLRVGGLAAAHLINYSR